MADGYAPCVCGHVQAHHGKQELAMLPYYPDCQWRGCGCPRWVEAPQDEPTRPPEPDGCPVEDCPYLAVTCPSPPHRVVRHCGCADNPCSCMRSGGMVASDASAS